MDLIQLRTAVEAERIAFGQCRDDRARRSRALNLYEMCCAYEQVCSDLYFVVGDEHRAWFHTAARDFATLASQVVEQLVYLDRPDVQDVVARIEELAVRFTTGPVASLSDLPERYVKLPECFMRDLLDVGSYALFARGLLEDLAPTAAIVVGIRSSGSYLAPVWEAALRSVGRPGVTLTARPARHPRMAATGRYDDPSPQDLWIPPEGDVLLLEPFLQERDPRTVTAVVVDDLAFTGSQFLRVDNYLRDAGITAENVVFVQGAPLVMNSLTPAAYDRLSARRVRAAPRVPDAPQRLGATAVAFFQRLLRGTDDGRAVEVTSVDLAPPTSAQRYMASRTTVPVDLFVHFNPRGRDRHYVIGARIDGAPTRLFAKVLGAGFFAERELRRIRRFEEFSYRVVAHRGGFLFYEWIVGEPFGPDDGFLLSHADIDRISGYIALLGRLNPAGHVRREAYARDVARRLGQDAGLGVQLVELLELATSPFLGSREMVPMVDAPRNHGYWHYVRAPDGTLRRMHLDLGEWSCRMDVAEELASVVVELNLSAAQSQRLVAGYVERSGDRDVVSRMALATTSYAARTLDSYRYWDGQIEQLPARFRRTADDPLMAREEPRRTRILRGLDKALGIGDPEMVGRV